MIFLDANFFIYCHADKTEKGQLAREILKKIRNGKKAATSSLAIDEVMWVMIKNKQQNELRGVIQEIYSTPNLKIVGVGSEIPLTALELIEEGLKPRDAFHAAVMKSLGINEIVTSDPDFDRIKWIKRIKL